MFDGAGKYGIPQIEPEIFEDDCEFVGFNYARGNCSNTDQKVVHFFLDDYQFYSLWRNPDRYVDKLSKFRYVLTPDFSTYTDFPKAIQIYNHYRKHWVGAYLQEYGCRVIPTISWSTPDSLIFLQSGILIQQRFHGCSQNVVPISVYAYRFQIIRHVYHLPPLLLPALSSSFRQPFSQHRTSEPEPPDCAYGCMTGFPLHWSFLHTG
jgi:hypothetical protein